MSFGVRCEIDLYINPETHDMQDTQAQRARFWRRQGYGRNLTQRDPSITVERGVGGTVVTSFRPGTEPSLSSAGNDSRETISVRAKR